METPPVEEEAAAKPVATPKKRPVLWGLAVSLGLVFAPYVVVMAVLRHGFDFLGLSDPAWVYNAGVMLLLPLVQGFVAGFVRGKRQPDDMNGFLILLEFCLANGLAGFLILREGVICLIMAMPLIAVVQGIAFLIGRGVAESRSGRRVSVSLAPLILLAVTAETAGPPPDAADAVSDSIVIHAPAAYVWKYVVAYPENPAPADYWMWRMGLPAPVNSVADAPVVGARRACRFTGGQSYEERITALEPGKRLDYVVTKQMTHPEIAGHVSFDRGEIRLSQNPDGTTTLTTTGWYRLHVRPAPYFMWWSRDVTRHIHSRTLGYIRRLAEGDYARAKRRADALPT